jgi:hypothetical protein
MCDAVPGLCHASPVASVPEAASVNLRLWLTLNTLLAQGVGGMKVPMNTGMSTNMSGASPVKPANMMAAPAAMEGMEGLNAVQQAVCNIIGQNKADTGCSITDIEQALGGQFDATLIREATEWLSSEGHVYPTIDDNHFQLCQA